MRLVDDVTLTSPAVIAAKRFQRLKWALETLVMMLSKVGQVGV